MFSLYCKCRKSAIAARERQAAAHISAQPAASVEGRAGRVQARKLARSEVAQDLATWQKLQVEFGPILDTLSPPSPAIVLAQAPNSCSSIIRHMAALAHQRILHATLHQSGRAVWSLSRYG